MHVFQLLYVYVTILIIFIIFCIFSPFWAAVREEFFSTGPNKDYMAAIEKAAFYLNLDDTSPNLTLVSL